MSAATIFGPAPSTTPTPTPTPTPTGPIGFQDVNSSDTGVWDIQKQDIHDEAAVLCKHNDVDPLRAMLFNGFQGTLNTKPSKAIINRTRDAYRRVADPAFFREYLEETKRRISEGCAYSETYCEEIRAIATSGFDAQTRTDRVVERIFSEICNQVPKFFRNVKMSASSEIFMDDLCATLNPTYNIQARTDRVVERLFEEIWREVYDRQAPSGIYATVDRQVMSELIEANIAAEERLQMGWEDKLLEQRFKMLDMSQERLELDAKMELDARIKLLERELEILDMEVENKKKVNQQRDEMTRKAIKWLIFSTSQFMASFET